MDRLQTLDYALDELRRVVGTLDDSVMDAPTNCDPWTVRRLASHALNNQLVWAGLVTGQQLVSVDDAMDAVPIDGDLGPRRRGRGRSGLGSCGTPTGSWTPSMRRPSVSFPALW